MLTLILTLIRILPNYHLANLSIFRLQKLYGPLELSISQHRPQVYYGENMRLIISNWMGNLTPPIAPPPHSSIASFSYLSPFLCSFFLLYIPFSFQPVISAFLHLLHLLLFSPVPSTSLKCMVGLLISGRRFYDFFFFAVISIWEKKIVPKATGLHFSSWCLQSQLLKGKG